MSKPAAKSPPPDQLERQRALDSGRSILVQAPAGSGKTDLLTRRFLRLLAEVDEPGQVVAITFTNAAAAEMRHRILAELEKAAANPPQANAQPAESAPVKGTGFSPYIDSPETMRALAPEGCFSENSPGDDFSMDALAHRALDHSRRLGWKLLDLPAQLRISTIDSFCRDLALQQPLLSSLGGGLDIAAQPEELYRRAARRTLEKIDQTGSPLAAAIEELLLWRDNGWQEMEGLLVEMLGVRDRWMHGFVLEREPDPEEPNPDALRQRLERPFAHAIRDALTGLSRLLDQVPGAPEEALQLARFACEEPGAKSPCSLAECVEIPLAPFPDGLDSARDSFDALAEFLLTQKCEWRSAKGLNLSNGFPATPRGRVGKTRFSSLIASLAAVPGLESTLAAVRALPPAGYPEEDWQIVRACFTLLRHAAGELQIAFAEAGAVDFIEVAQIAQRVLRGDDGLPTDAAMAVSDGIRHLLVDEFQDTSRRQHQLLSSLIAAWPERTGRTGFAVGDPMQSIYFFRDADAELFPRVKAVGLEIPGPDPSSLAPSSAESLLFDFVPLKANFRTAPSLVDRLNEAFERIFAADDGSGVTFSSAQPARDPAPNPAAPFTLHLRFVPQAGRGRSADPEAVRAREASRQAQIEEIVALIRSHQGSIDEARQARERGEDRKFRIAVLGRAKNHLVPIAQALREANEKALPDDRIPFRAVELESLAARPEVLDALALARALLNPQDRVAWLGVLRAPWCGLSLDDLHTLAGDPELLTRPLPELLAERLPLLSEAGRPAAARVLHALAAASALRAAQPTASLGTWLEQVWLLLGGAACVDETARANLNLLWSSLDRLPGGEQDLLGPGLDAALDKLTALPDPGSSSDCGVQLMTIHKSKGLEFEVVIVPELQAASGRGRVKLLSWLERGLAQPDDSGEITEFLIAPLQPKGADRGRAKAWVDRVYRERESQETRRILYVAATRAREQLHLFARPACKEEDGSFTLVEPSNSLLATAWPALEEEVCARFEDWKAGRPSAGTAAAAKAEGEQEGEVFAIAAAGESNLLLMPSPLKPTLLRRLPPEFQPIQAAAESPTQAQIPGAPGPASGTWETTLLPSQILGAPSFPRPFAERTGNHESQTPISSSATSPSSLYPRHEGGLLSRALGTAVHTLLEELARLRARLEWTAARSALQHFAPRIAAQVRATGVDQPQAAQIAAQALSLALNASHDPIGSWILSPHPQAASEAAWAGVVAGALRTVRVDRVFQAGPAPGSEGEECWWIVDYKTAHADNVDPASALPQLRALFAPQLEAYAQLLRNLHGADTPIRAGLYYPRMLMLDSWQI